MTRLTSSGTHSGVDHLCIFHQIHLVWLGMAGSWHFHDNWAPCPKACLKPMKQSSRSPLYHRRITDKNRGSANSVTKTFCLLWLLPGKRSRQDFNPQSNVTGPNISNVVAGGVFSKLDDEKKYWIYKGKLTLSDTAARKNRWLLQFIADNYVWFWENTLTNHVFVAFHYCAVVVAAPGNLYRRKKITKFNEEKSQTITIGFILRFRTY